MERQAGVFMNKKSLSWRSECYYNRISLTEQLLSSSGMAMMPTSQHEIRGRLRVFTLLKSFANAEEIALLTLKKARYRGLN